MSIAPESFDPQQSLRIIRETIDVAKKNISENGFYFMLWGGLVAAASFADWYMENMLHSPQHGLPWMAMVIIGVPAVILYGWKNDRQGKEPSNMLKNWYSMIWIGFGASMMIALPMAGLNHYSPVPVVLILAAFATFMSGTILQFTPLRLGAIALWAGALACFWISPNHHNLVEAISIILGYLVPGLLLNNQYRQLHAA